MTVAMTHNIDTTQKLTIDSAFPCCFFKYTSYIVFSEFTNFSIDMPSFEDHFLSIVDEIIWGSQTKAISQVIEWVSGWKK
jgi:hypothetical protein